MTDKGRGLLSLDQKTKGAEFEFSFKKLFGLIAILVVALFMAMWLDSKRAGADEQENHFFKGEIGWSYFPLCDTREQAAEIIRAHFNGGFPAAKVKYLEYFMTRSPYGGPVCFAGNKRTNQVNVVITHERVGKFDSVPDVAGSGETQTMYIIRVTLPNDTTKTDYHLVSTWDVATREHFEELVPGQEI